MIDPARMLACVLVSFSLGESPVDQDGEITRLLRRAHEVAVTMSVDRIFTKFGILTQIAQFQACVNDHEESSKTIEDAFKVGGDPSFHQMMRNRVRMDVLQMTAAMRIEQGNAKAAVEPLREYARLAAANNSSSDPISFYLELVKLQARAGDREGAADSAKRIQEMAEKLPEIPLIRGGIRAGVQTRSPGLVIAAHAFGLASERAVAEDLRRRALREAESIGDQAKRRGEIGAAIVQRAMLGDVAGAVDWLDSRPEIIGDGRDDLLAFVATNGAEYDPGLAVRTASRIGDIAKRLPALSSVAGKLGSLGRWKEAAVAWEAALPEGQALPRRDYLAELVYAHARAGEREAALASARRALREAERPDDDRRRGNFPHAPFFARLAAGLWLAGDRVAAGANLDRAMAMADAIRDDSFTRSAILNSIAATYGDMGDFERSLQLLTESMIQDANLIRPIIEAGASARLKAGDVDGALRLFGFLVNKTNDPFESRELARKVAKAEARDGDPALARRWAEGVGGAEYQAQALIGVCSGLLESSYKTP